MDAACSEQRGIRARDAGQHAEAEGHFAMAVLHAPDRSLSWLGLALSQIDLNRPDEAVTSLRRAQELSPQSAVVSHLIDSLNGNATTRAPDGYVNWLFNTYAPGFDKHLARLGYQGPGMLHQLAQRAGWTADGSRSLLDLGCGTGLSGLPFKPYASRLEGIDLSLSMLAQADRRGIYDELRHGEIHAVLGEMPVAGYDAVIAGDTLIYIGNLSELFRLVADRLKAGGSFLFTVETGSEGFSLASTGRYQQSDAYLRSCAEGLFEVADRIDAMIRVEAGQFTPARAYRFTKI
ncbi:MAG: methyltransferase domain-containing protein [Ferrovibrio sp.]